MATAKPPFMELGSGPEIIFKIGFHKEHPEIPSTMSESAQRFILRCFEIDPDKRATAASLLEDLFLQSRTKKSRGSPQTPSPSRVPLSLDFRRSHSMPVDSDINNKPENSDIDLNEVDQMDEQSSGVHKEC